MKSLLPQKYHYYIYAFALCLLVVGLPLSKFLMSLSQFILLINWILEGNLKDKFNAFLKNKPALLLSSLLLLHFLGLIYTSDFDYAFRDIRIKIPLFLLPLIISTSKPLSEKLFNLVLKTFLLAVLFGTIISVAILSGLYKMEIIDTRGASIFISHIRFALLICVSFFISIHYFRKSKKNVERLSWGILTTWWVFFLTLIESLTGLGILSVVSLILLTIYFLKQKNTFVKYGSLAIIGGGVLFIILYSHSLINSTSQEKEVIPDFSKLEKYSPRGNIYAHDVTSSLTENGYLIWIYICDKELRDTWNSRSKISYDGNDLKGNNLAFTLIRFLASKGLKKDADGINALSVDEIKAIESGIPNIKYQHMNNLQRRLYETKWEIELYKTTGDANGHSLTQRFEYWKTALGIIKANPVLGVGTGDVAQAFNNQYIISKSILKEQWRLRSHNQYLSITVAFGVLGFIWFFLTLIYPALKMKLFPDFLYLSFFLIAMLSFLTEDTLETQAGVTFYAFLNTFFLFAKRNDVKEDVDIPS